MMQDLSDNDACPPASYAIAQMMAINTTLTHLLLGGKPELPLCVNVLQNYWHVGNGFNDHAADPLAGMIKVWSIDPFRISWLPQVT